MAYPPRPRRGSPCSIQSLSSNQEPSRSGPIWSVSMHRMCRRSYGRTCLRKLFLKRSFPWPGIPTFTKLVNEDTYRPTWVIAGGRCLMSSGKILNSIPRCINKLREPRRLEGKKKSISNTRHPNLLAVSSWGSCLILSKYHLSIK